MIWHYPDGTLTWPAVFLISCFGFFLFCCFVIVWSSLIEVYRVRREQAIRRSWRRGNPMFPAQSKGSRLRNLHWR